MTRFTASNVHLLVLILTSLAILLAPVNGEGNVFDGIKKRLNNLGKDSNAGGAAPSTVGDVDEAIHMEAATGTIPHKPTPEEKARVEKERQQAEAGSSCDDILVLNLAKANEKAQRAESERDSALNNESAALDRIATLETELAELQATLGKERKAHEVFESETKLEISNLQKLSEQKLTDQKDESNRQLLEETKKLTVAMEELDQAKSDEIKSLQDKLKMDSQQLHQMLDEQVSLAEKDRDEKVAALKQQMDDSITAIETERDQKLAEMTAKMEKEIKKAAQTLSATKEEADAVLKKQMKTMEDNMKQMKASHDDVVKQKNDEIKKAKEYSQQILQQKKEKDEQLMEIESEVTHWRALDANRTYCNMTMVKTDLIDGANTLYDTGAKWYADAYGRGVVKAKEVGSNLQVYVAQGYKDFTHHASVAKVEAVKFFNTQAEQLWPKIQPLYDEYIVQNYQRHLEPHVKEHVQPKMEEAMVWYKDNVAPELLKLHDQASAHVSSAFKDASKWYGSNCLSALRSYRKSMREVEALSKTPDSVLKTWKDSCLHPDESIEAAMKGFGILLCVIFWRRILNLTLWIVSIPISIILTITPLGFIFPRRSRHRTNPENVKSTKGKQVNSKGMKGKTAMKEMASPVKTRSQRKEAQSSKKETAQ